MWSSCNTLSWHKPISGHLSVIWTKILGFHAKQYHWWTVWCTNLGINKWIKFNQMNSFTFEIEIIWTNRLTAIYTNMQLILKLKRMTHVMSSQYHYNFWIIARNERFYFHLISKMTNYSAKKLLCTERCKILTEVESES